MHACHLTRDTLNAPILWTGGRKSQEQIKARCPGETGIEQWLGTRNLADGCAERLDWAIH
jgi:hypothetical protein